jgi:hypothetical protein
MRCYFLSGGHIVSVEELTGLSDEAAVAKAHEQFAERKAVYEGFEVWQRTRVVFRHPDPAAKAAPKGIPDRQGQP